MSITHFGTVVFENGTYQKKSGSDNWSVQPIDPVEVPVGQIRIIFTDKVSSPYSVQVTGLRHENTPCLSANYGNVNEEGFRVHLWETIADRTVVNANFSFMVLSS